MTGSFVNFLLKMLFFNLFDAKNTGFGRISGGTFSHPASAEFSKSVAYVFPVGKFFPEFGFYRRGISPHRQQIIYGAGPLPDRRF